MLSSAAHFSSISKRFTRVACSPGRDLVVGADPEQLENALTGRAHAAQDQRAQSGLREDQAAAALAALTDGHTLRRELSRRIRDDLITLGIVSGGPAVTIADGTHASCGDLIICTRNDHSVEAGEPGRTLANGDLLRIEAVPPKGLLVRRALDPDPRTGQRRWTARPDPSSR